MNDLTDRLVAATTHWLNGDPAAAWDEGLLVEEARIVAGRVEVTFSQAESDTIIRAAFGLMDLEMTAKVRA